MSNQHFKTISNTVVTAESVNYAIGSELEVINAATGTLETDIAALEVSVAALEALPTVLSNPTAVVGADVITNMFSLTQAEYDVIGTPHASTLYVITE